MASTGPLTMCECGVIIVLVASACLSVLNRTGCYFCEAKVSVPGKSYKQSEWLIEWLSTRFFSMGQRSNGGCETNEILHKGSLGGEDDARTSNTRIAHRQQSTTKTRTPLQRQTPNRTSVLLVTALCTLCNQLDD